MSGQRESPDFFAIWSKMKKYRQKFVYVILGLFPQPPALKVFLSAKHRSLYITTAILIGETLSHTTKL